MLVRVGDSVRTVDELGDVASKALLERLVKAGQFQAYESAVLLLVTTVPIVFAYPADSYAPLLQACLHLSEHLAVWCHVCYVPTAECVGVGEGR